MSLLAAVLLAGLVSTPPPPSPTPTPVVPLTVGPIDVVTVAGGETATVRVPLFVADGHRVQANPASGEFLVPLSVELDPASGFLTTNVAYPVGEPYRLHGSDEELSTYRGTFEVMVDIRPVDGLLPGDRLVRGTIRFQGCNSRVCLFPASVPLELRVTVTDGEPGP